MEAVKQLFEEPLPSPELLGSQPGEYDTGLGWGSSGIFTEDETLLEVCVTSRRIRCLNVGRFPTCLPSKWVSAHFGTGCRNRRR